ncbi:unnamed protein product [Boreogadus saida]
MYHLHRLHVSEFGPEKPPPPSPPAPTIYIRTLTNPTERKPWLKCVPKRGGEISDGEKADGTGAHMQGPGPPAGEPDREEDSVFLAPKRVSAGGGRENPGPSSMAPSTHVRCDQQFSSFRGKRAKPKKTLEETEEEEEEEEEEKEEEEEEEEDGCFKYAAAMTP